MRTFKDFAKYYNDKDVVPTLEAIQKKVEFYHKKKIDMMKIATTLPSLANRILHQSSGKLFSLFSEEHKDLDDLVRTKVVRGPSIVFHRFAKVQDSFIRDSNNKVETILGVDGF